MSHRIIRITQTLAAGVLIATCGCVGSGVRDQAGGMVASPHPVTADIPLPVGFRLVDQSSEDWASGSIRYVRHRYTGKADKSRTRQFYREQMPLVRWVETSDSNVHGRYTMKFERGAESCTITIQGRPPGMFGRVTVDVIITPIAP